MDMYCTLNFQGVFIDKIDDQLYLGNICAAHNEVILKVRANLTLLERKLNRIV